MTAILCYQAITKYSAVDTAIVLVCLISALSVTNMVVVGVNRSLFELHFSEPCHDDIYCKISLPLVISLWIDNETEDIHRYIFCLVKGNVFFSNSA